jgi:hypothetical protein
MGLNLLAHNRPSPLKNYDSNLTGVKSSTAAEAFMIIILREYSLIQSDNFSARDTFTATAKRRSRS